MAKETWKSKRLRRTPKQLYKTSDGTIIEVPVGSDPDNWTEDQWVDYWEMLAEKKILDAIEEDIAVTKEDKPVDKVSSYGWLQPHDDYRYYTENPIGKDYSKPKKDEPKQDLSDKTLLLDEYDNDILKSKLDNIINKDYTKQCDCKTIADCDNRCKGNAEDVLKEIVKLREHIEDGEEEIPVVKNDPLIHEEDEMWEVEKKKKEAARSAGSLNDYIKSQKLYFFEPKPTINRGGAPTKR